MDVPNPAPPPSINIGQMLYANKISTTDIPDTARGIPANNGAFGGMNDNVGGDVSGVFNLGDIWGMFNIGGGIFSGDMFSSIASGGIFANISTSMLPSQFKALLRIGLVANFAGARFGLGQGITPSQQGQVQTTPQ
jgi:hypothetical protein